MNSACYTSVMFAVVRHTYEMHIPEPFVKSSQKSFGNWIHKVWVFDNELDAMSFAITLLEDPFIQHDNWAYENALQQLQENRFYQMGKESIAIAEVEPAPEIYYENDNLN